MVVNRPHSGRMTDGAENRFLFIPRLDRSRQRHIAFINAHSDPFGFTAGAPFEHVLDQELHAFRLDRGANPYFVGHSTYARKMRNCAFGVGPLAVIFDIAFEHYPAVCYGRMNLVGRDEHVPFERVTDGLRDLRIGPPQPSSRLHLDVIGDIEHAGNTVSDLLRSQFLRIAVHCSGERDDSFFDRHADFAEFESRIPIELKQLLRS